MAGAPTFSQGTQHPGASQGSMPTSVPSSFGQPSNACRPNGLLLHGGLPLVYAQSLAAALTTAGRRVPYVDAPAVRCACARYAGYHVVGHRHVPKEFRWTTSQEAGDAERPRSVRIPVPDHLAFRRRVDI